MGGRDKTQTASGAHSDRVERRRGFGSRRGWTLLSLFAVIVILPSTLVILRMESDPKLSLIDEAQHLDYIRRVEQGELPRIGDRLLSGTMREIRCRGVLLRENPPCPPAGTSRSQLLTEAPVEGFSYEAQQPPLYYVATALLRRPIALVSGGGLLVTARLTGIVWLVAGLSGIYWLGRKIGASHAAALLSCVLVAGLPTVLYQSSTVNNDATALVAGGVALAMVLRLREEPRWWPWLLAAGIAGVFIWLKPVAIIAFWTSAVFLLVLRAKRVPIRTLLAQAAVLAGTPALAYQLWSWIADSRATVPPLRMVDAITAGGRIPAHGFPWDNVPDALRGWLTLDLLFPVLPDTVMKLGFLVGLVLVASGLAAIFEPRRLSFGSQIGAVALGALTVAAVGYVWYFASRFGVQGGAQPRYGLVLVPWFAVALSSMLRNRRQFMIVGALAGALVVTEVTALI